MKLQFFFPRWGSDALSWDLFCSRVKLAGFDGVEAGVPDDPAELALMQEALYSHGLQWIAQYWHSFESDVSLHVERYEQYLYRAAELKPVKLIAQTGKDYFSAEQNSLLFDVAARVTADTGVQILHETHRNKALYSAPASKIILTSHPDLQIAADFSHWCTVSESFLEDQDETVELAIQRAGHIHARVGHPEGPQVTDPRLPVWRDAVWAHLRWWRRIYQAHIQRGAAELTINPEFGPAPYMPQHPVTGEPLADQWAIIVWMKDWLQGALISQDENIVIR